MPTPPTDLHELVAVRLRAHGQRYTRSRRAIVEVLAGPAPRCRSPRCSSATGRAVATYRNLTELEEAGVVHRVLGTDEFSRYELAEDLAGHHHHLICSHCGDVRDFTVSPALEAELQRALDRIAGAHGFAVDHHRLDLIGTCDDCV